MDGGGGPAASQSGYDGGRDGGGHARGLKRRANDEVVELVDPQASSQARPWRPSSSSQSSLSANPPAGHGGGGGGQQQQHQQYQQQQGDGQQQQEGGGRLKKTRRARRRKRPAQAYSEMPWAERKRLQEEEEERGARKERERLIAAQAAADAVTADPRMAIVSGESGVAVGGGGGGGGGGVGGGGGGGGGGAGGGGRRGRSGARGGSDRGKRPREQPPPAPTNTSQSVTIERARVMSLPSDPHVYTPTSGSPSQDREGGSSGGGGGVAGDFFNDAFENAMSTLYDDMRAWDVPQLIAAIKGRDDSIDNLSAELNEFKVRALPPPTTPRSLCPFFPLRCNACIMSAQAPNARCAQHTLKSAALASGARCHHRCDDDGADASPFTRPCTAIITTSKAGGAGGAGGSGDHAVSITELKELRAKVAEQALAIADLKAKLEASIARGDKLQRELQMGRSVKQVEEDEANAFAED
jgi:hypothetical protein